MPKFTRVDLIITRIPGTANANVRALCAIAPTAGDSKSAVYNLDCAVFGDDPVFDDLLFRFPTVQIGGPHGSTFEYSQDVPVSTLNEDPVGNDELYAAFAMRAPSGAVVRARTPSKVFNF